MAKSERWEVKGEWKNGDCTMPELILCNTTSGLSLFTFHLPLIPVDGQFLSEAPLPHR